MGYRTWYLLAHKIPAGQHLALGYQQSCTEDSVSLFLLMGNGKEKQKVILEKQSQCV